MDYLLYIGSLMCVWIIVSVAVNLVIGYTGMMAMGHAAYLGIGAYTAAGLNIFLGVDYFSAMAIAALAGAVVAVLTLLPLLRLNGFYFALATLGLNFVFFDLFHNLAPRVEGTEGLYGLKLPAALAAADTTLRDHPVRCASHAFWPRDAWSARLRAPAASDPGPAGGGQLRGQEIPRPARSWSGA